MRLTIALTSFAVALGSAFLALVCCEVAIRVLDGQPILTLRLPPAKMTGSPAQHLEPTLGGGPLPADIDGAWIGLSPPPLTNPPPRDPELERRVRTTQIEGVEPLELIRIWNRRMVTKLGCRPESVLAKLPQPFLVFDAPDQGEQPPYRYPPSRTLPEAFVTNRFGWRGPDIPLDKPSRTIRVAFAGASTTVGIHKLPFSYPEYVIHWLNLWAARAGLDVRFDGINAGREGLASSGIAAVIRDEVLPLEPDLVIYYEGANQSLCTQPVPGAPPPPQRQGASVIVDRIVSATRDYSETARRLEQLMQRIDAHGGYEPPKPSLTFEWFPPGLDEARPDIIQTNLPKQERNILNSLDWARAALPKSGSELALSSFVYLVFDGLRLDPLRHVVIYNHLNKRCWPYRYSDLRRGVDLHNQVLEQYALQHQMPFIDVAAAFPNDPDLFFDAIHLNDAGTRVHAWIVFRALVPLMGERIDTGAWPSPDREPLLEHPNIKPAQPLTLSCSRLAPPAVTAAPTPQPRKDETFF